MKIDHLNHLPTDINTIVLRGLEDYEREHGVDCGYVPVTLVARDEAGEVIAVLAGYTAYEEVYVDDLWVAAAHRRQGIGRALMARIEEIANAAGAVNINLVTNAFQAVEFYRKCGFDVEFIRHHDTNPKLTKTFLIKRLGKRAELQ